MFVGQKRTLTFEYEPAVYIGFKVVMINPACEPARNRSGYSGKFGNTIPKQSPFFILNLFWSEAAIVLDNFLAWE